MNNHQTIELADGPARDERFNVVENWSELSNEPDSEDEEIVEFLHRQMNEEINGLEISARNLCDFPDTPWELRMSMARQCWDEARHIEMFRSVLEGRGGNVGDYPVINFQYRILTNVDNLSGRLAVQNRSFEAAGIDAIQDAYQEARKKGEADLEQLFDVQLADEIQHVRFANEWLSQLQNGGSPAELMAVARAVDYANRAFAEVAGEATTSYPLAEDVRIEAGFTREEVAATAELLGKIND